MRGLGVHSQGLARSADRERVPPGGFEGDRTGLVRDLAGGTAHDSGQGQRSLRPRHDPDAAGQDAPHAVQRGQAITLARPAHDELALRHAGEVEGMGRMSHLHHHVVREVDHVVDRAHADGFQPVADPGRRRPEPHVQDARAESRAEVGGLDGHVESLGRGRPRLREGEVGRPQGYAVENRYLSGHAVDVHAVHAVGGDVEVEHGFGAPALQALEGEADEGEVLSELARLRRDVDELTEPRERNLQLSNCSRKRRSFP